MVEWHHRFNGHEFEQAHVGDGQGSLACCSPWGHKESDITARLNSTELNSDSFNLPFPNDKRRRQWQPTPYSCLENPMDGGAW